jgi:AmmeMemoRadiSam system protein A
MNSYVALAKGTVEEYVRTGKKMVPPASLFSDSAQRRAGVFVTILKKGELRGCIGTFLPTKKNIIEEIISNAVAAASADYRFGLVRVNELKELSYEVSVLDDPWPVKAIEKHDPQRHGIIVKTKDGRLGLLLPGLEGVRTTDQQIEIASQKGGINPRIEEVELFEFTVEKYS